VGVKADLFAIFAGALVFLPAASAQAEPELRYVAIISRHGVRSPTGTAGQLNAYSAKPWPLSGMLNLSWILAGYAADDTPPGGAMVFELWRTGNAYSVRTYFIAQSLEQIRNADALTVKSPPLRAPVFVPGCGTAAEGFACEWNSFQKILESSIDRSAVK